MGAGLALSSREDQPLPPAPGIDGCEPGKPSSLLWAGRHQGRAPLSFVGHIHVPGWHHYGLQTFRLGRSLPSGVTWGQKLLRPCFFFFFFALVTERLMPIGPPSQGC